MWRHQRAAVLGLALALGAGGWGCDAPVAASDLEAELAARRPLHVVLIVVDTLGADRTTPYGFERDTTPQMARLAERGARYERAFSGSGTRRPPTSSPLSRSASWTSCRKGTTCMQYPIPWEERA